jgi:hypothetical protein
MAFGGRNIFKPFCFDASRNIFRVAENNCLDTPKPLISQWLRVPLLYRHSGRISAVIPGLTRNPFAERV